jgi:SAM-dependent methyltransferase
MAAAKLDSLVELLKCQKCGSHPLQVQQSQLICGNCSAVYPLVGGAAVFRSPLEDVKVFPTEHVSNQISSVIFDWLSGLEGMSLNIGAGGTLTKVPSCIEMEYSVYRNTDVVGDAHELPFQDNVFEVVVAFNVFEHLREPTKAAQEIFRVLKPGGKVMIHTAFLQPLHEEPVHFYNATKYGVMQWFSNFEVKDCQVSWNFNPAFTLGWLSNDLLYYVSQTLGEEASEKFSQMTLKDLSQFWSNPDARQGFLWDSLMSLPQSVQERFSAGFELVATKPHDESKEHGA